MITPEYRALNAELHKSDEHYGTNGYRFASQIQNTATALDCRTALDYGAGKCTLSPTLPHLKWQEYDPAIPSLASEPLPADLVVCTDVLEHVESQYVEDVLAHMASLALKGIFLTVESRPAKKTLPDGRNAHISQHPKLWWQNRFKEHWHELYWAGEGLHLFIGQTVSGNTSNKSSK